MGKLLCVVVVVALSSAALACKCATDSTFLDNAMSGSVVVVHVAEPGEQSMKVVVEKQLAAEALASARADKLLAQEEVWIRKGVEARRTRSVARVQRLQRLREQRKARRESLGQVRLEIDAGVRSGKVVAELRDVSFSYAAPTPPAVAAPQGAAHLPWGGPAAGAAGAAPIVGNFNATILRGDKVGLIGPNGAGKTTLLKLILGELQPGAGTVRRGTNLRIAYFDQLRSALDLDATLADSISPGSEWVEFNGQRKHVISYLNDFLFAPERAHSPLRTLSGGERNRVLLARLFALPANVLVLDEPTNDLDIETLELLEEQLGAYSGTVLLVSHDRAFLDAVVTSTLVLEGDGRIGEYVGGYSDWEQQRPQARPVDAAKGKGGAAGASPSPSPAPQPPAAAPAPARRKLTYKDQRELELLPARIEALEAEIAQRSEAMNQPGFFARDGAAIVADQNLLAQRQAELEAAYVRWQELEG